MVHIIKDPFRLQAPSALIAAACGIRRLFKNVGKNGRKGRVAKTLRFHSLLKPRLSQHLPEEGIILVDVFDMFGSFFQSTEIVTVYKGLGVE